MRPDQSRTYDRASSVVFLKTDAPFGGLSNMARGFPLRVNGVCILTSEALYQACRFPHRPDVQRLIIGERSPMTAKMKSKPYRRDSRHDWDLVRVKVMRWCLRVKLAQNWFKFSELLLETGGRPIVEESRRDDFWGAKAAADGTLVGMNVLGRLLMELREAIKTGGRQSVTQVQPVAIPEFVLDGRLIGVVSDRDVEGPATRAQPVEKPACGERAAIHPSLFDGGAIKEAPAPAFRIGTTRVCIADLKPYPEYKGSSSKWLGSVPASWEVRNLRTLISKRTERDRADLPLLSVAREKGVFVRSLTDAEENHNVIPEDLSNYKVARAGNLVINKMKAWQGSMGIAPCDGIVSPAYFVFDFRIADHAFGQKLLRSRPYVAHFGQASDGVRVGQWDLSVPGMRQIPVLVPPPPEQAAIVRFLDWANGRLERAIRAKRKVIALLNEQKQAIIHRAVTHGLDPSVPLKPSGIPWLGDIPQHWEVRRVKQATRILRGRFSHRPRNDASLYDGQYPFIQTGAVAQATKFITSYSQTLNEKGLAVSKLFPSGTLIMTIAANIGEVAVLTFDACFPDSIVGFVPSGSVNRDYLYLVFLRMKSELLREAPVNTQGNLNLERIGAMGMPVPPLVEQEQIARGAEPETAAFDAAISRLTRETQLLREYRTRLVADVVTGKLDVREASWNLPDEAALDTIKDDGDAGDDPEAAGEEISE